MSFWITAGLVCFFGLGIGALIFGAVAYQKKRMLLFKEQLLQVADRFEGHFIDRRGWGEIPKLVLHHHGKRFHVSFKQSEIGNLIIAKITSNFVSPVFELSVVQGSPGLGWFGKKKYKTNDNDFDAKFQVSANEHGDSIDRIVSRTVRRELSQGCVYVEPERGVKKETRPVRPIVTMRTKSCLIGKRIKLNVEAGQAESKMYLHLAEFERLGDILLSVMAAQTEIEQGYTLLSKENGKLKPT